LLIAKPKQVPGHDPNPLPKTNQDRIVRAEKLMSSDPRCQCRFNAEALVSLHLATWRSARPTTSVTLTEARRLYNLDTLKHLTQLDLPANSEVRVCHYQAGKIVSLKGPPVLAPARHPERCPLTRVKRSCGEHRQDHSLFLRRCDAPSRQQYGRIVPGAGLRTKR
jgi:hypothetical protein